MFVPRPGDIGVTPSSGLEAAVIRRVTKSPVAHAFLAVGATGYGSTRIIEAEPRGARYNTSSAYARVFWLPTLSRDLTPAQRVTIVDFAVQHLGTPYSWIDDAEIGFVDLFGRAPGWMRRRLASDRTLMCSQLCDAAYQAAGVQLFADNRPAGGVAPGDLYWAAGGAA